MRNSSSTKVQQQVNPEPIAARVATTDQFLAIHRRSEAKDYNRLLTEEGLRELDARASVNDLGQWENRVVCIDCVEGMKQLPAECADMFVFSPPYDSLREYQGRPEFDRVQPVWLQRSRRRKPRKSRGKATIPEIGPRQLGRWGAMIRSEGLNGDAQGTYPDR